MTSPRIARWIPLWMLFVICLGCTGTTQRIAPDDLSDDELGTGLTSQDFRSIAQRMARSLITLPQIASASVAPKVAFVSVDNRSADPIDADSFLRKMRTEIIKHSEGRVIFLDRQIIDNVEQENRDKGRGRRTAASEAIPLGADFFLTGVIESIDKVAGAGVTSYLRVSFRLTDAGTSAIVWEDDYEIKKHSRAGIMYQ